MRLPRPAQLLGIRLGLVLLACGVRGNVIRFLAPLTAPAAIVDEGLDLLEQALSASLA